MNGRPLVSVVMSVYSGDRYLAASLDSVLSQEDVEFEVVVVDDGSTDLSPAILADYARKDPRVRVIRQENAGLTKALARGCAEATGDLIARQDADDVSLPGRLAKLAAVMQQNAGVAVAASWVESIGPRDEPLSTTRFAEGPEAGTRGVLEERRSPVHGSAMFRKADLEAVGGYRPEFYFAQDSDLWFRLADRGDFLFLPEVLYAFRVVGGSISVRHREAQLKLYDLARACRAARLGGSSDATYLREASTIRPAHSAGRGIRSGAADYFLGSVLLRRRDPRALGYMRAFVRQRPGDPRGWVGWLRSAILAARRDSHAPPTRDLM